MSSYRMDKIQFSSNLPNFINVKNDTGTITVSGTVGVGATFFSGTISLSSRSNFFTLYAVDSYTGNKYAVNNVGSLYLSYSPATALDQLFLYTTYVGNNLNIFLYVVNNNAIPITLISQTYTFTAVEYQLPF